MLFLQVYKCSPVRNKDFKLPFLPVLIRGRKRVYSLNVWVKVSRKNLVDYDLGKLWKNRNGTIVQIQEAAIVVVWVRSFL